MADYLAVLDVAKQGLALHEQYNYPEYALHFLFWQARAYRELRDYTNAEKSLSDALRIVEKEGLRVEIVGHIYAEMAHYCITSLAPAQETLGLIQKALEIASEVGAPEISEVALLAKAGVLADVLDSPNEALEAAYEALRVVEPLDAPMGQSLCHLVISRLHRTLKNDQARLEHCEAAVQIARRAGIPLRLHAALLELALCHWEALENGEQSAEYLRQAIDLADRNRFPVHNANTWFLISFGQADWTQIAEIQNRTRSRTSPWEQGAYYFRSGHIAFVQGEYAAAEDAYRRASELLQSIGADQRSHRRIQPFLGFSLFAQGMTDAADREFTLAADYWKTRNALRYSRCLRGKAQVCLRNNLVTTGIAQLQDAYSLASQSYGYDGWPEWQNIQLELSHALVLLGKFDEAHSAALSAYVSMKNLKHFLLPETAFVLAEINLASGKIREAQEYAHEAQAEWERLTLIHLNRSRLAALASKLSAKDKQ